MQVAALGFDKEAWQTLRGFRGEQWSKVISPGEEKTDMIPSSVSFSDGNWDQETDNRCRWFGRATEDLG